MSVDRLGFFIRFILFSGFVLHSSLLLSANKSKKYVDGDIIVKLKGEAQSMGNQRFFQKISGKLHRKNSLTALNVHHFSIKTTQNVEEMISELKNDSDVLYAEPNYYLYKIEPREASAVEEFSLIQEQSTSGSFSQNLSNVKVNEAWQKMTTSTTDKPIVAIIDTGVDYNHSVFVNSNAIWTNPVEVLNGLDDDGNGYIDDIHGWNFFANTNDPMDDDEHGTHVAGIVLGVGQDIFANPTTESKIRIMPLKFLSGDGSGTTASAISAIYYAVNMGAKVINNSWGGDGYTQSLHDALAYAYQHQVLIACASGNYSSNNDATPIYPANYPIPSLISVAATNDWDMLATFSNYGYNSVHVTSPGVSIKSTIPGNRTRSMSGTSMAAPFVAGLAALAFREAPSLTGFQIKI